MMTEGNEDVIFNFYFIDERLHSNNVFSLAGDGIGFQMES